MRAERTDDTERRYLRAMAELGPGPMKSSDVASLLGRTMDALAPARDQSIKRARCYAPRFGEIDFTVPRFGDYMKRWLPAPAPTGPLTGVDDDELRSRALAVLEGNRRDGYTVPALGLYPYQWCWDSGPIALGWAAAGRWADAWGELARLLSAQWPTGLVPHIVFWNEDDTYFPGPDVWATGRNPPTTGLTQPPLPVSAAARLFCEDPDRARARRAIGELWPRLVAWLAWIHRARSGPHGAAVVVHPWESGMDNSPSWDQPLSVVPEATHIHLERRDVATVSAKERPSQREYRQYLGIVEQLRAAHWDTERQPADSPFAVEDPGFTAITARAAADLVAVAAAARLDGTEPAGIAAAARAGLAALWDDELGWFRPYDVRAGRPVGPVTSTGLVSLFADVDSDQVRRMMDRVDTWGRLFPNSIPTSDPGDPSFDAIKAATRALVEEGFSEYYDPRSGAGIGGQGFSWSAALTLAWLTRPARGVTATVGRPSAG